MGSLSFSQVSNILSTTILQMNPSLDPRGTILVGSHHEVLVYSLCGFWHQHPMA